MAARDARSSLISQLRLCKHTSQATLSHSRTHAHCSFSTLHIPISITTYSPVSKPYSDFIADHLLHLRNIASPKLRNLETMRPQGTGRKRDAFLNRVRRLGHWARGSAPANTGAAAFTTTVLSGAAGQNNMATRSNPAPTLSLQLPTTAPTLSPPLPTTAPTLPPQLPTITPILSPQLPATTVTSNTQALTLWDKAISNCTQSPAERKMLSDIISEKDISQINSNLEIIADRIRRNEQGRLGEMGKKILKWVDRFKGIGDVIDQFDPAHAALPWAGFLLLLQVELNPQSPQLILSKQLILVIDSSGWTSMKQWLRSWPRWRRLPTSFTCACYMSIHISMNKRKLRNTWRVQCSDSTQQS